VSSRKLGISSISGACFFYRQSSVEASSTVLCALSAESIRGTALRQDWQVSLHHVVRCTFTGYSRQPDISWLLHTGAISSF
jgi:hypothetical protein